MNPDMAWLFQRITYGVNVVSKGKADWAEHLARPADSEKLAGIAWSRGA